MPPPAKRTRRSRTFEDGDFQLPILPIVDWHLEEELGTIPDEVRHAAMVLDVGGEACKNSHQDPIHYRLKLSTTILTAPAY